MSAQPSSGSTDIEYDLGLPHEPLCHVPLDLFEDPHGERPRLAEARVQRDTFPPAGMAILPRTAGASGDVCDLSDLSGGAGNEDAEASCP